MNKEDQEYDEIFQLQQMYLNQLITKQLQERNLIEPGLSKIFIQFCKQSTSDQQFQQKVFEFNTTIIVSKYFITSLYHTIKQQLPKRINYQNQNQQLQEQKQYKKQESMKDEKIQQKIQYQLNYQKDKIQKQKNLAFPGLALQNNDQIDLDLNLTQSDHQQIQEKVQIKRNLQVKQKYRNSRSYSVSSKRDYKRSLSNESNRRDHQRSRKKDKKHKQKKQKKDKKHKKHYSSQSQRSYYKQRKQHKNKHWQQKRSQAKGQFDAKIQQKPLASSEVTQGSIHRALIKKVQKNCCIVSLIFISPIKMATLHLNQIKQNHTGSAQDIIKQGQKVWVKIISILDERLRVSMKNINQYNGKDMAKMEQNKIQNSKQKHDKVNLNREIGHLTGIKISKDDQVNNQGEGTSYGELWELSRLGYMGKINKGKPNPQQDIQEVNIQVNDRQPPFLTGQTTKAGINLSPVRIVKNPQGTMQRQAQKAIQYAKQRRQIRQKTKNQSRSQLTNVLNQVIPDNSSRSRPLKRAKLSITQQRQSLPIYSYRQQLIKACMDNRILIVIGQTGSGKTTQITQYLHQAGFSKKGKIGCTQPRRVAAMSVAKRVCEEMDVQLGDQVGYSIRFQDYTSSKTIIKYMTDGMLLREALLDKYLSNYSVIMLDQAHERTIHTDVLFGILKKVAQKRKDFTLIVTSATLQAKKFSSYFFDCKIFSIPGRTYNVEILYAKEPQTDYLDAALMCVLQIHIDEPPGDILLFLTGQQQIDTSCQILNERMKKLGPEAPQLIVLPVYSALPSQLQSKIFDPAPRGKRKCVIATNIAEASLTIDGIYYVVDPGFCKVKIFNSKLGMDTLVVAPISQASSKQRAGRAGRTGPGKCYRLYTEQAYQTQMLPTSVPEIQRANLSNTVLQLKAMGINDLINFDFMDAPPIQTLIAALQQLYYLSALDQEGLLTKVGRKMAEFPLEPPLSKMLLTSIDFGCTEQIATIISLLSVQNVFYRPKEKQTIADQKKTKFHSSQGDHLTYLAIFDGWKKAGFSQSWCHENYIQLRSLKRAQDVKKQIIDLLQRYKFKIQSCNGNTSLIRKTIVSGFFFHAAKKDAKGGYRTLVDDHQVYIHPSSALFNKQPEWVIYHQLIFTSKQYMRDVCAINPKWLIDVAPNFFKFTDQIGFSRKKRNEKLDPLNQKYGDPNAWRLSKRKG